MRDPSNISAFDRINFYTGADFDGPQPENTTRPSKIVLSSSYPVMITDVTFNLTYGQHCTAQVYDPVIYFDPALGSELVYTTVNLDVSFFAKNVSYIPHTQTAVWQLDYRVDYFDPYLEQAASIYGSSSGTILTQEEYAFYITNGGGGTVTPPPDNPIPPGSFRTLLITPSINLRVDAPTASFVPVSASGGTTPYTWSVVGSALPTGLSLDTGTGAISGTPTVTQGGQPYTIRVQDSAGGNGQQTFSLGVNLPGGIIPVDDYNNLHVKIASILGSGPDGYGASRVSSSPASRRNRVTRTQWDRLIRDINVAHIHVTNTSTTTLAPMIGQPIYSDLHVDLGGRLDWLEANKFTCHPQQYFNLNTSNVTTDYGTSTRTLAWSKEIVHKVRVDFPTDLMARYFFNTGGELTWYPYYESIVGNDLDAAWVQFSDYLVANGDYKYTRDDYVNESTNEKTTTYNSGTLSVTVHAVRRDDITSTSRIDLTATYRNTDVDDLVVDPVTGYWNYVL